MENEFLHGPNIFFCDLLGSTEGSWRWKIWQAVTIYDLMIQLIGTHGNPKTDSTANQQKTFKKRKKLSWGSVSILIPEELVRKRKGFGILSKCGWIIMAPLSLFVGHYDACLHEAFSQVAAKVLPHILPEGKTWTSASWGNTLRWENNTQSHKASTWWGMLS